MELASRIQIVCFAASYAVSIVHELVRVFWPQRWLWWIGTGFAYAGLAAQTLFLVHRALAHGQLPIATYFESIIAVSWLVALVYLYLTIRDPRLAAGLFVLPVSLALVVYAAGLPDQDYPAAEQRNWFLASAHGVSFVLGAAVVVVAFLAALTYLVKVRQLKTGLAGNVRLPSLERLDRVNSVAVYLAYALLTVGMLLGFALQQLLWRDPKVVTSVFAWCLFTALTHYRYRPENRGRKVALLTIVACLVVFVSVLGDPWFGSVHQAVSGVGR